MKLLKGWKLKLLTGLALASSGGQLQAQMGPGSMDPSLMGPGRGPMAPASYRIPGPPPGMIGEAPMDPSMMDPNLAVPGCDNMSGDGCGPDCGPGCNGACGGGLGNGGGLGGRLGGGGFGNGGCGPGCNGNCGGLGCGGILGGDGNMCSDRFGRDRCGFLGEICGLLSGCRGKLRPYGEGGVATQRWFDVYAEGLFLARTKGGANFNTTSLGAGTNNFVLGTNQLDFDQLRAGLGLQANIQTGPGSNLEVTYFGLNKWEDSASVTSSTPSLFSFISAFGTVPAGGFDDPDRSFVHSLDYSSELHNGEINFRRRWTEPHGFFQGSFLAGVRYIDLDEQARFSARGQNNNTQANNGLRFFDYTTDTQNSLVGFQVGADLWYNWIPGVKVGVEGKTGAYNNRAHQITSIVANSIPGLNEEVLSNRCAYVTQLSSQLVYRLNYSWSVRSSYQIIYIDGVALATENFNATPPALFLPNSGRTPTINSDAEIVLQGFSIGAEYSW